MFWNDTGILQVVQKSEPFQQVKKILPFTGEFSIGCTCWAGCWASWCEADFVIFRAHKLMIFATKFEAFWHLLLCHFRLSTQMLSFQDVLTTCLESCCHWMVGWSLGLDFPCLEWVELGKWNPEDKHNFQNQDVFRPKQRVLWSRMFVSGGGFLTANVWDVFEPRGGFANREAVAETVRDSTGDTKTWSQHFRTWKWIVGRLISFLFGVASW